MPLNDVRQVKNEIMYDLAVTVRCFIEKGWTSNRIAKKIPNKKWNCSCENLSTKKGVNCLRTSKILRMLSDTNGMMLTMRR